MRQSNHLGEFEHVLLLTLAQLQGKSYGTEIRKKLKQLIGRDSSIGALYATLERMERKGFILSSVGEPSAERGGRAKRYFELTAQGKTALRETRQQLNTLWRGLEL